MGLVITGIDTLLIDRYLLVEVHTNAGITGLGESGAWGFLEASAAAVGTFKRYLIGQDPVVNPKSWTPMKVGYHAQAEVFHANTSNVLVGVQDPGGAGDTERQQVTG